MFADRLVYLIRVVGISTVQTRIGERMDVIEGGVGMYVVIIMQTVVSTTTVLLMAGRGARYICKHLCIEYCNNYGQSRSHFYGDVG